MATAMEINEVSTYVSDEEITISETVVNEKSTIIKRRQRNSVTDMLFNNIGEVEKAVVKENQWNYYYTKITTEGKSIDVMKKMKWYTFDQYTTRAFNIWFVTLPMNQSKWLGDICNCPAFFEKFMRKHVVGMVIRLNYCKPPVVAKNIRIGEKRRRIRPSKAKKALLVQ